DIVAVWRICTICIIQDALAQAREWDDFRYWLSRSLSPALIAVKKEQFVLYDWATQCAPKGIPNEFGAIHACLVAEPIVCLENTAAIELKGRAMPLVASALCDKVDLCSGRAAFICIGIDCGNTKFLDRFSIQAKDSPVNGVALSVVDVHAIKRDIGLVAPSSGN